jgi:hypothetical protein
MCLALSQFYVFGSETWYDSNSLMVDGRIMFTPDALHAGKSFPQRPWVSLYEMYYRSPYRFVIPQTSILWRWNIPPACHLLICRSSIDSKRLVYFYVYKKRRIRRPIFWSVSFQSDIACLWGAGGGRHENAVKTVSGTTPALRGSCVMIRMYEHCMLENRLRCESAFLRCRKEAKQEVSSKLIIL